jgi:hypothetical protein
MVDQARCPATAEVALRKGVAGRTAMVVLLCWCMPGLLPAQGPPVHYWHQGSMPPGAIGGLQLQRGGPLPGFFQPVKIKAPPGALISLAEEGQFAQPQPAPVTVGLLIGQVYRLRVMRIPLHPGVEVFPTIEVIDRLYTPPGHELQFPIVVELTPEELRLALDGKFVTRVIYVEDPWSALPIAEEAAGQNWFEVGPGRDPLAVADQLGRPVAILRMGARLPDHFQGPDMRFLFGCPPVVRYPLQEKPSQPPGEKTPAEAAQTTTTNPQRQRA